MSRKFALFIGSNDYEDLTLAKLKTPASDVRALAGAMRSPAIGGFDEVAELINQPESDIRRAISQFFALKKPEDLLLLYFSGHGVLDDQGRLFLAVKDTRRDLLKATAIPAGFITTEMDDCRSKRQILILDCCHSGAFVRGGKGTANVNEAMFRGNGYGRVVLTASNSTQYALEGDQVIKQAELSLFSHYLLEGLITGEADSKGNGLISLDDWYDYAYGKIVHQTPQQTPQKWTYSQQGELIIARNPHPIVIKPATLPIELLQTIESPYASIRAGAVQELERLLKGSDKALAAAALEMLEKMADDDSRQVQSLVAKILTEHKEGHSEATTAPKQEPDRFIANVTAQSKPNLQPEVSKQDPDTFTANIIPTVEKARSEAAGKIGTESARKFSSESVEQLSPLKETHVHDQEVSRAEQQSTSYWKSWFTWSLLNSLGWAGCGFVFTSLFRWFVYKLDPFTWLPVISLIAYFILAAGSLVRQRRFQLGWWVLVSSIGGAMGSGLIYSAMSSYQHFWYGPYGAWLGAFSGCITGILTWNSRRRNLFEGRWKISLVLLGGLANGISGLLVSTSKLFFFTDGLYTDSLGGGIIGGAIAGTILLLCLRSYEKSKLKQ